MIAPSYVFDRRLNKFFNVGAQLGVYTLARVRLAARLIVPLGKAGDDYDAFHAVDTTYGSNGFVPVPSKAADVLLGGGMGFVVTDIPGFRLAPGVAFLRANVSDYGTIALVSLPFEWTEGHGVRIGFTLEGGFAFGGSRRFRCDPNATPGACASGATRRIERPLGLAMVGGFQIGWEPTAR